MVWFVQSLGLSKVRIYLKVKGRLFITASSKAGRGQQAVDPVGDPAVKDEVSLNDSTLSIINKDFSLFKADTTGSTSAHSSSSVFYVFLLYLRCHPSLHRWTRAVNLAASEPSPDGSDLQRKSEWRKKVWGEMRLWGGRLLLATQNTNTFNFMNVKSTPWWLSTLGHKPHHCHKSHLPPYDQVLSNLRNLIN